MLDESSIYRELYLKSPDAIVLMQHYRILDANESAQALFGATGDDLVGRTLADFTPPGLADGMSYGELLKRNIDRALDGETQWCEWQFQRADGAVLFVDVSLNAFAHGSEAHIVQAVIRDISKRRQMAMELEASNEQLRFITENQKDVLWIMDLETRNFLYVSPSIERQRGFTPDEVIAGALRNTIDEESLRKVNAVFDRRLEEFLESEHIDSRVRFYTDRLRQPCKDGRWISAEVVARYWRNPRSGRIELHGMTRDVTESVEAQEQLEKSKEELRTIVDALPSALIAVDEQSCVTIWNNGAETFTGITESTALRASLPSLLPDSESLTDLLERALGERRNLYLNNIYMSDESPWQYVDLLCFPVGGKSSGGAVIRIDDVTERKHLHEIMVQSEKMLSLGGLAAGMAHEINNPLGGIIQIAEVMRTRLQPELAPNQKAADAVGTTIAQIIAYAEQRKLLSMLDQIWDAADRASIIVKNMLNYARQTPKQFNPCDILELVDQTITLATNEFDLKKNVDFRRINIVKEFGHQIPLVRCDYRRIQQVFLNLFKNSAQALSTVAFVPGEATITIRVDCREQNVRIQVEDNGPGIPSDINDQLFVPFFTTKRDGDGTGLGLPICKFIIEEHHHGTLDVESAPGRYTRFTILLPLEMPD